MVLRLPVRQYIAVPSGSPRGLVTETWELPIEKTAFVELHCWNIGIEGGIPVPDDYWVYAGSRQNHERAARIVIDVIAPTMQAARRAGMPTVHVQPESVAARYPELCFRPPRGTPEQLSARQRPETIVGGNHAAERAQRVHGPGYMTWDGWDHLDVAPPVKPQPGDVMIVATDEFDEWAKSEGIDTLVFTGFCTNLCILDSPAAMKAMAGRGYRCVILREGTLAIEFEDMEPNQHTEAALRYIESWVGYTASVRDFVDGLKRGG